MIYLVNPWRVLLTPPECKALTVELFISQAQQTVNCTARLLTWTTPRCVRQSVTVTTCHGYITYCIRTNINQHVEHTHSISSEHTIAAFACTPVGLNPCVCTIYMPFILSLSPSRSAHLCSYTHTIQDRRRRKDGRKEGWVSTVKINMWNKHWESGGRGGQVSPSWRQ